MHTYRRIIAEVQKTLHQTETKFIRNIRLAYSVASYNDTSCEIKKATPQSFALVGQPSSSWTANSDKKLNVNKPCVTS